MNSINRRLLLGAALSLCAIRAEARNPGNPKRDEEFVKAKPAVGDVLPRLTVDTPEGRPFDMAELDGQYTVLVFGCLT